jgi:hypothetical protein
MADEIKPIEDETPETEATILDLQAEDDEPDVEAHCSSVLSVGNK